MHDLRVAFRTVCTVVASSSRSRHGPSLFPRGEEQGSDIQCMCCKKNHHV